MSASPAPKLPTSGSSVDQLFDFAASHARVTKRLKAALHGNCAAADDFETLALKHHMQGIYVVAKAEVGWKAGSTVYNGVVRGDIQYVSEAALERTYRNGFDASAARPEHVRTVEQLLTSSPQKGFAAQGRIDLGAAGTAYACNTTCGDCCGNGQVPCNNLHCSVGRVPCWYCDGKGNTDFSGRQLIRCSACSYGRMNCRTCNGLARLQCGSCNSTGSHTVVWTGRIHADVSYEIRPAQGHREDWATALTKGGHAWLADAGFVSEPGVARRNQGASVGWEVNVPVMIQKFRIKEKEYEARYVGRNDRMWRLPHFLDDLMGRASYIIENAKGADAFSLSRNVRVLDAIRSVVLDRARPDETLAASFENAVSVSFIEGVRRTLESKRDAIARSTIKSVWSYAAVALTVGALVALASGQVRTLLASFNPNQHQPDAAAGAAVVGGLFLAASLGITWLLAGLAGRSAVRTVLETDAERLPSQGRTPIFAAAGSLAVYAACAYLLVGNSPNPAATSVSRPASVAAARPAPAPPPLPFDSIPHVKPPTVPWVR